MTLIHYLDNSHINHMSVSWLEFRYRSRCSSPKMTNYHNNRHMLYRHMNLLSIPLLVLRGHNLDHTTIEICFEFHHRMF